MGRTLRIGDQGADVRAIQDALNFQIRRLQPLAVDGIYGPKTQARVSEFQRSNALSVDGVVGNATAGKLFETEIVPFSMLIMPRLQLTLPQLGGGTPSGIQPPRLIPPLTLPGQPAQRPALLPFQLFPSSFTRLPALAPQGQLLTLTLSVPARNDPLDPALRSFQQIIQLLDSLPPNFPFRAALIGAVPTPAAPQPNFPSGLTSPVPTPFKRPGDFNTGFKWGIDPVFDLKKAASPTEFTVGAKGNARYTFGLINRGASGLRIGLFVAGDFKAELDYTSEKAQSRPLLHLEGAVTTGLGGVF